MLISFSKKLFTIFTSKVGGDGIEYANYATRYAAMMLDLMLMLFLLQSFDYCARFLLSGFHADAEIIEKARLHIDLDRGERRALLVHIAMHYSIQIFEMISIFLYSVIFTKKLGGTPAKLILGIRIVSADGKSFLCYRDATKRFFSYFLSILPLGSGILWGAFDKKSQMLHDKMCSTIVVKKDSLYSHIAKCKSQELIPYGDPFDLLVNRSSLLFRSALSRIKGVL